MLSSLKRCLKIAKSILLPSIYSEYSTEKVLIRKNNRYKLSEFQN